MKAKTALKLIVVAREQEYARGRAAGTRDATDNCGADLDMCVAAKEDAQKWADVYQAEAKRVAAECDEYRMKLIAMTADRDRSTQVMAQRREELQEAQKRADDAMQEVRELAVHLANAEKHTATAEAVTKTWQDEAKRLAVQLYEAQRRIADMAGIEPNLRTAIDHIESLKQEIERLTELNEGWKRAMIEEARQKQEARASADDLLAQLTEARQERAFVTAERDRLKDQCQWLACGDTVTMTTPPGWRASEDGEA